MYLFVGVIVYNYIIYIKYIIQYVYYIIIVYNFATFFPEIRQ